MHFICLVILFYFILFYCIIMLMHNSSYSGAGSWGRLGHGDQADVASPTKG